MPVLRTHSCFLSTETMYTFDIYIFISFHFIQRSDTETASGIRKILNWIHKEYPISVMYMAGYLGRPAGGTQSLQDTEHVQWYKTHINQLLKGIVHKKTMAVVYIANAFIFLYKYVHLKRCKATF